MASDALGDDVIAEDEWRHSMRGGGGGRAAAAAAPSHRGDRCRFAEYQLGILTDGELQRELIKNDLLLLKLNLPAYEIDEMGEAVRPIS